MLPEFYYLVITTFRVDQQGGERCFKALGLTLELRHKSVFHSEPSALLNGRFVGPDLKIVSVLCDLTIKSFVPGQLCTRVATTVA